jgi:hypothetical protein
VESYLSLHQVALLEDLDNSVLLLGGAELSLEGALGGRVVGALVAVPIAMSALLFAVGIPLYWCSQDAAMVVGLTCG